MGEDVRVPFPPLIYPHADYPICGALNFLIIILPPFLKPNRIILVKVTVVGDTGVSFNTMRGEGCDVGKVMSAPVIYRRRRFG